MASTASPARPPVARRPSTRAPRRVFASALARESTRVSRAVGSQLQLLVSSSARALPSSGPIASSPPPALTLELGALLDASGQWSARVRDAGGPTRALKEAFQAIALVLKHSQLLDPYPGRKVQFWRSVLGGSDAIVANYGQLHEWMLAEPRFPSRIELSLKRASGAPLSSKLTDAIYEFLTTPAEPSPNENIRVLVKDLPAARQIGLGLSFARTNMTIEGLQLVAELLERVFASPDRQFAVEMLDLSHNAMDGAMLMATTEILKKNAVYQIKDIRLDSVVTATEASKNGQIDPLLKLIQVVLDQRSTPQPYRDGCQVKAASELRSLSLAGNRLGARHFAAVCSAMRYGCAVDALSLASTTLAQVDPRERQQCWRWLAFGVFCPRSKRFDSQSCLRKIDLSSCTLDQVAIDAMKATLSSPVAELRQVPDDEHGSAVMICVFKPGTRMYSSRDTTSASVLILSQQRELEMLYSPQFDDDWRCVVVPGVGISWVESRQIRTVVEQLDVKRVDGLRYDLVLRDLPRASCSSSSLSELLVCVGPQLGSLDLGNSRGDVPYQAILDHCLHLQHLGLDGVSSTSGFLQMLCGSSSGRNLLSLNLSRADPGSSIFYLVTLMMAGKQKLSRLRELRLSHFSIDDKELAWLHGVLHTNHSLLMLELDAPSESPEDELRREQRDRLNEDYNNKSVVAPLPTRCVLAFVSVLSNSKSRVHRAGFLDVPLLKLIVEFAAEKATRRIIWRKA